MKRIAFSALLLLLIFSACRKDIDDVSSEVIQPTPAIINSWTPSESIVTSSVIGFVVDEQQQPVAGVRIKMGNFSTTTDDYGHFFYNDVNMNELGQFLTAKKDGYFEGSRRFFPSADDKNRVKIELLTKEFNQSFEADAGATITVNGGASIEFSANSVKVEDGGAAYTGTVSVAAKWLDPSSERTFDQMPGNLQGVNISSEEVALATYGMIAVELQGSAGEVLNIADNAKATLRMPVPAELQTAAPAEIPLWSFYESHGIWAQESTATLQGDVYVGEVSHFSFWNCDAPFPLVVLDFRLVDEDGYPLSNYKTTLTRSSNAAVGYGWSNQDGEVSGKVPLNEELLLEVYGLCGGVIFSQNIGPFTANASLGDLVITGIGVNSTVITGRITDCNDAPVTEGLVTVSFDNYVHYEYIDGNAFEIRLTTCDATTDVELIATNFADFEQNSPLTIPANVQTDLGDVRACGQQLTEYLRLTVDGQTMLYPNAQLWSVDSVGSSYTYIYFNGINNPIDSIWGSMFFGGITTGDYSSGNSINMTDNLNAWSFETSFASFTVDNYGIVGEDVTGQFSGTIQNYYVQPSVTVDVSGEFRLKRQQ